MRIDIAVIIVAARGLAQWDQSDLSIIRRQCLGLSICLQGVNCFTSLEL